MVDSEVFDRLSTAREFIDDCFDECLDLATIARRAHLSPFHFQRLFRNVFELTPHQYMTRRRIERAKELLIHTEAEISEICLIVGFQSLGSFSTLFSRLTGFSPSAYRHRFGRGFRINVLYPTPKPRIPSCFLLMLSPKG